MSAPDHEDESTAPPEVADATTAEAVPAESTPAEPSPPPITVNGEVVEERLIREETGTLARRRNHESATVEELDPERLRADATENAIERVLLRQKAREIKVSKKEVEAEFNKLLRRNGGAQKFYQQYGLTKADDPKMKEGIKIELQVQRYLESVCADVERPSREAVEVFYTENQDKFLTLEAIHARHILVRPGRDGAAADLTLALLNMRRMIQNGADFAEIAARTMNKQDGNSDLGWVTRGMMVPPFEEALFKLQAGELSDVIRTSFGLHLIEAIDRRDAEVPPLNQVAKDIEKHLLDRAKNEVISEHVDQLLGSAIIERPESPDDATTPTEGTEPEEPAEKSDEAASEKPAPEAPETE